MHIEFADYLKISTTKTVGRELSAVCSPGAADAILAAAFSAARVEDCPPGIAGVVVSDLAFVLSKLIAKSLDGFQVVPAILAQGIVQELQDGAADTAQLFAVEAGGLGYLNGTPADWFVDRFITGVASSGPGILFRPAAFITAREERAEESCRGPVTVAVDWPAAVERSRAQLGGEFSKFEQFLAARGQPAADDVLMVLALLADPELDIDPYLLGLSGSENVPWYLRRFCTNWRSYYAGCGKPAAEEGRAVFSWPHKEGMSPDYRPAFSSVDAAVSAGVRGVLQFRRSLFDAVSKKRPELLVRTLLKVVHCFYSYYNHPKWRRPGVHGEAAASRLGILSKVLGEIVECSLKSIEFPCGKCGFVLNLEDGS